MTQRRRMSRADVERTPLRTVMPGVSARLRWGDEAVGFALSREAMLAEVSRYGTRERSGDQVDAVGLAWQSAPDAWVRRAAVERRAVERTGRILVAWLIGRWRRG